MSKKKRKIKNFDVLMKYGIKIKGILKSEYVKFNIYIYIYRERERDSCTKINTHFCMSFFKLGRNFFFSFLGKL